ncbi:MAG: hypothetical protein WDN75_15335 [Bacteroidota bacterium]
MKELEIKRGEPSLITGIDSMKFLAIPNYLGRGYGYFHADEASRNYMLETVNKFPDPEARAGIWMNCWEYVLRSELGSATHASKIIGLP